jgi:hypothetical protein
MQGVLKQELNLKENIEPFFVNFFIITS